VTAPTGSSTIIGPVKTVNIPSERAQVELIQTLADVDPIGRTEALIYGPPGSGKTVLAATFPGPIRWIAADGANSLKSVRWAFKEGMTSFQKLEDLQLYVPQETVKGRYIAKANAFNLMQDMIDYWFKPEQVDTWQTLVMDSFTEINTWALDLGLGLNVEFPSTSKPLSTSDQINRKAMTRMVTGQQDYKTAMGLIEGFLRNVRIECSRHNKHLVILCHEWQDTTEGSSGEVIITAVRPLLIGQLRDKVSKDFDDVWHMERYSKGTGIEVKVRVHGDNKTLAKTRWGTIMPREVEPDYRKMIAEVKKYHGL
jgi:hypothetical protein